VGKGSTNLNVVEFSYKVNYWIEIWNWKCS